MKSKILKRIKIKNKNTDWNNWKWQIQHSIKSIDRFEKLLNIKLDDGYRKKIEETTKTFPVSITPYYLSLIEVEDYMNDPIFKQAFPDPRELEKASCDMSDPLSEDKDSPVETITHRYPDRVLFHISNVCAMYCRHCTRKRKVGDNSYIPNKETLKKGIDYIKGNTKVRDVLLSGGDPFLLNDNYIDWILNEISQIEHVEIIRIGTRTPVVLPYRITSNLVGILKKYKNLWINTHFNHPREITETSSRAISMLVEAGIPIGNQSVLLRDVNDCPRIMKKLVQSLVANRIRPYYLYQCDLSIGLEHFRTSIGKGIEIMESLRGHTTGFAVPTYVIDAPGGGGKIPVMPNYIVSWSTNKVILRNFEGVITTYNEPDNYEHNFCDLNCADCNLQLKLDSAIEKKSVGVSGLLSDYDKEITLTPTNLKRMKKRKNYED
jgi:lysine 2,3-aminomutase